MENKTNKDSCIVDIVQSTDKFVNANDIDEIYGLNICVEDGIPKGVLTGLTTNYCFDPRIVLCELRYDKDVNLLLQDSNFAFDDFDYKMEFAFDENEPFVIDKRDKYVAVVNTILRLIKDSEENGSIVDFRIVETLRSYFDLQFKFTPSVQLPNVFKIPKITYSKNPRKDLDSIFETEEYSKRIPSNHKTKELSFDFYHTSYEKAISYDVTAFHNYFYQCYSQADIIFSIFHFLVLCKYKFKKCEHCGKYFATQTLKQMYCYRNSPYPKYEHLECSDAVKDIKQNLRRMRRKIENNLYGNQPLKYDIFITKSAELLQTVKKHPTIDNINKAFDYINTDKWYKRKKK